jgi:hypothetical protein
MGGTAVFEGGSPFVRGGSPRGAGAMTDAVFGGAGRRWGRVFWPEGA